jgi:transposase
MQKRSPQEKIRILRQSGTLHPEPEKVRDAKFHPGEFFDPHDMVQVKYEMLRRVSVEKASVSKVAAEYGVSRPTYYQTRAGFKKEGIAGLLPKKRGPHGPHKLKGARIEFIRKHQVAGEPIRARWLARQIAEKFALKIHPRTIERAVTGKKTAR